MPIRQEDIITHSHKLPVGELIMGSLDRELCICDWRYRAKREAIDRRLQDASGRCFKTGSSEVIEEGIAQLAEYFAGQRQEFTIALRPIGTDFQKKVWKALRAIPFGKTITYAGLASSMNSSSAIRAVAAANGANALSIFIPCHRVIGSQGKLVGYAGGLSAKKILLELEGSANQMELEF